MTQPYTKEYQGPVTAQCEVCNGHGFVTLWRKDGKRSIGADACPKCARLAEKLYRQAGLATSW